LYETKGEGRGRKAEQREEVGRERESEEKRRDVRFFSPSPFFPHSFVDDDRQRPFVLAPKTCLASTRTMFLSRASLPRLQVRSQRERLKKQGVGALFRCSNSRERFSSVPQLYSITSKPVPAPALAPASAARHSCSFVIQARRTPLDEIRVVKAPKGVRERERKRERRFCFVFLSFLVPHSNKKLDPRPLTLPLPKKKTNRSASSPSSPPSASWRSLEPRSRSQPGYWRLWPRGGRPGTAAAAAAAVAVVLNTATKKQ